MLHYLEHRVSWHVFSSCFISSVIMGDAFSHWIIFGFDSPFSGIHTMDLGFFQFAFAWHILENHFNFNSCPVPVLASHLLYSQLSSYWYSLSYVFTLKKKKEHTQTSFLDLSTNRTVYNNINQLFTKKDYKSRDSYFLPIPILLWSEIFITVHYILFLLFIFI